MEFTIYVQNPEDHDNQGLYLKAQGEEKPWMTETDVEEFDAILDDGEMIANLTGANLWCLANKMIDEAGQITALVWW